MSDELRPGENPEVERVSGYRKLKDAELNFINALKADGARLDANFDAAKELIVGTSATPEQAADRMRSLALAKTNIQQGYMWFIRAIAAPEGLV